MLTLETLTANIENYRYPYGTSLTVADIQDISTGQDAGYRLISTDPEGLQHTYILRVRPGTTLGESTKDGKDWDFSMIGYEYWFYADTLAAADISNDLLQTYWFDAVLREDAQAHLEAANQANPNHSQNRYGGQDLASQLERVEKHIVEYSEAYVAIDSLTAGPGIKEWLEKNAPHQIKGWEFFTIDDSKIKSREGRNYLLLQSYNTTDKQGVDNPDISFMPHAYKPGMTVDDYLSFVTSDGDIMPLEPFIGFRLDGQEITHFNSNAVLGYEQAKSVLTPARGADFTQGRWLAVRAPGLPMLLLIPPHEVVLHLYIDEDGAMTVLEVLDLPLTHLERQRDEMFTRRWGRYLDENIVITEADCAPDIAYLHDLLAQGK